ncbi:hypothetical protein SIPHO054v2_p0006 [Vibrio phage 103E44.1]|nr:hypothetical protein SIPHO054v2_p0006 [Vibrio phage 103E44.1]QZI87862.1 hypothetical protein SIPHO055v2_p0006 [Vibrio phage 104E43.1]
MSYNLTRVLNKLPHMIECDLIDGFVSILKFGTNADVDTTTEEDIWSVGGTLTPLVNPETLTISSTEAFDILITGVNGDWDLVSETVSLDGTLDVVTSNEFIGVISAQISPDSPNVNAVNITGTSTVSDTVQFQILANYGQTEMTHFIVPKAHTAFMYSATVTSSRNDNARVRFQQAIDGTTYITKASFETNEAPTQFDFSTIPVSFEERSRIRTRAKATTNNTSVTAVYQILLVKNELLELL